MKYRYQPCTGCGRPIIPIPEAALAQIYGAPLTGSEAEQRGLCQECRRKAASQHIHDAFLRPRGCTWNEHEGDMHTRRPDRQTGGDSRLGAR